MGGRHAPYGGLQQWMQVAAPIPGWAGFSIGRSIWWDPLAAHLAGTISADVAEAQIAENYLYFAHAYLNARSASPVSG